MRVGVRGRVGVRVRIGVGDRIGVGVRAAHLELRTWDELLELARHALA